MYGCQTLQPQNYFQLLKDSIMRDWDVQAAWNPTLDFPSVDMFIVNDM